MESAASNKVGKFGDWHHEDWSKMWEIGDIGFHQNNVHPDLLKYEAVVLAKPCRVFLPLCGKSLDLSYLAEKGHDVFGCELSEKAIVDFFKEQSLSYEKSSESSGCFEIFKAVGRKITFYKGDLFSLGPDIIGKFDVIWDRASLVAINIDQRLAYAKLMVSLMEPQSQYLLEIMDFDGENYRGPPHSVTQNDVENLFSSFCSISVYRTHRMEKVPLPNANFADLSIILLKLK